MWCTWINKSTAAAPQFGIFNIKRKYFFKCPTSIRIKIWSMHKVFYEVLFFTDKQFMWWSFWTQWYHRIYSCTCFLKSQVVKLELFFGWLYREHYKNLKVKETWRNLHVMISTRHRKSLKWNVYFCFFLLLIMEKLNRIQKEFQVLNRL